MVELDKDVLAFWIGTVQTIALFSLYSSSKPALCFVEMITKLC